MTRLAHPDDFWHYVDRANPMGCWLWTGGVSGNYGVFSLDGKQYSAHRYSYEVANGPIPKDLGVCHTCDTPRCVRPDHLFVGTQRDNMRDAANKGHTARGDNHGMRKYPERVARGERHGTHTKPESYQSDGIRAWQDSRGVWHDKLGKVLRKK